MDSPTPRTPNGRIPLQHATDTAGVLLRRAQLLLAVLAVLIAVPIGLLAGASRAAAPAPHPETAQAELLEPANPPDTVVAGALVPVRAQWIGPGGQLRAGTVLAAAGLPRGAAVTVTLGADGTAVVPPPAVAGPVATGLVAGLGTLAACWSLLALAGAVWRSRLTARDQREVARQWARVEPLWSRRTV